MCVALTDISYIYVLFLIGPGTSGVSTSSTLGLGTSLSSLPSSALYGYTDTDSDLELDEVESAELKLKVEEASAHLAVELQTKEAYDTAANAGIDTTFLDPEQVIHMMSGRCLRSTPESTPIKIYESPTVEVGKGKERVKAKQLAKLSAKASENGKNSVQSDVAKQDETGAPGPNKENMAGSDTKVDGKKRSNEQKKGTHDGMWRWQI